MRIIYLTHQYLPRHVGGTEVYTHGLAARARRAGHYAHVITHAEASQPGPPDPILRRSEHEGVPVTEIHHSLSLAPDRARAEYDNPHVGALVRRELEAVRPDVVHALHLMRLSGAALEACYSLGVPVVLTLADFWFVCPRHTLLRWDQQLCGGPAGGLDCVRCLHQDGGVISAAARVLPAGLLRRASGLGARALGRRTPPFLRDAGAIMRRAEHLRRLVERARRVIALSDFQKEMFVGNGYPADRIEVLHHGLETAGLETAGLDAPRAPAGGPPEVVFVGGLVRHKGPHVLLEALARRPELKLRLLVYGGPDGDGHYFDGLKALADADPRVELMGTFPAGEMGRVLANAAALALPALWYENEPLVVKAALYAGVPVLASDIGTLADSVGRSPAGRLVPAGDVRAWAAALAAVCAGPLLSRAPDRSIKSMDENARELLAIYREVLSNE